jgi:hypothetical protein
LVRSPLALRRSREQNALHTLIRQRHPTPSCGGRVPTAERTLDPARMFMESLTTGPELENSLGHSRRFALRKNSEAFSAITESRHAGHGNSLRRVAPQFAGLAGSPTTTSGAQYLGSACSGCWSIIASMDVRSASACDSFGSAASAATDHQGDGAVGTDFPIRNDERAAHSRVCRRACK